MAQLVDVATGKRLGTLSPDQLAFLLEELEEESATDQDYYLTADTIALLEEAGADAELLGLLRSALGDQEGIDVAWTDE